MVGNTGTLMSMRIVRNKVHSRDDSAITKPANDDPGEKQQQQQQQQQKPQSSFSRGHKHLSISFRLPKSHHFADESPAYGTGKSRFFTTHSSHNTNNGKNMNSNNIGNVNSISADTTDNNKVVGFTRTSGISNTWVFPPNAPTPNIYHCLNTEELMAANDNGGFKGFRKQFSGRFKRLVATRKPEPTPVIPPHLKPQLKTIYVY